MWRVEVMKRGTPDDSDAHVSAGRSENKSGPHAEDEWARMSSGPVQVVSLFFLFFSFPFSFFLSLFKIQICIRI
jgi:hypothetical protein